MSRGRLPHAPARHLLHAARWSVALVLLVPAGPGAAQDFELAGPAWAPAPGAAPAGLLLERGLPSPTAAPVLEGAVTRWFGIPSLATRTLVVAGGYHALRLGLGLSQTGQADVGWTALGAALGAARRGGGASLRAVARRDRTSAFGFDARRAAVGGEVGGGAWIEAAPGLHVWAAAPQMWMRGEAPPLPRPLEIGAALDLGGLTLWLSRAGIAGSSRLGRGERAAGLAAAHGPFTAWIAAREPPLRGAAGLAARTRGVRVAAQVESHPVLAETTRLSLGLGGGP